MVNVEQIAYDLRTQNRSLEAQLLANLDLLELDEFEIEPLAVHWEELCPLGIAFQNDSVQMTINAHPQNLESAILYVLDINKRLKFDSPKHVTNTFVKALREGWQPTDIAKQPNRPQELRSSKKDNFYLPNSGDLS